MQPPRRVEGHPGCCRRTPGQYRLQGRQPQLHRRPALHQVLGKEASTFAKIVTWYDNEWGYSCRTADLAAMMASKF